MSDDGEVYDDPLHQFTGRPPIHTLDEGIDEEGADKVDERRANRSRHDKMVAVAQWLLTEGVCTIGWAPMHMGRDVVRHWKDDAQTDAALVGAKLGGAKNSLVIPKDRMFIVDCDDAVIVDIVLDLLGDQMTFTVKTPTPGHRHVYLLAPDGFDVTALPEVFSRDDGIRGGEVRKGNKGMVLGPWSRISDGIYEPATDQTIAVAPRELLDWLLAHDIKKRPAAGKDGGTEGDSAYRLPESVPEGGRYRAILSYTAHLYNRELSRSEMWALVQSELAPLFAVPLPLPELRERFDRAVADNEERLGEPKRPRRRGINGDDDGLGIAAGSGAPKFPAPPKEPWLDSLLGEAVQELAPQTPADPVGLLGSLLALIGPKLGCRGFVASKVTPGLSIVLVGATTNGGKGVAINAAAAALDSVYAPLVGQTWRKDGWRTGLTSGEGLVQSIVTLAKTAGQDEVRLTYVEEELDRLLTASGRTGSTLLQNLMIAYDQGPLGRGTVADQSQYTNYLVSLLGGITPEKVRSALPVDAPTTGGANRVLWLATRSREVDLRDLAQRPPSLSPELAQQLAEGIAWTNSAGLSLWGFEPEALDVINKMRVKYIGLRNLRELSLTQRLPSMTLRIALIYAGLEQSLVVKKRHVLAAAALADYAHRGLSWTLGTSTGNRVADEIVQHLLDPVNAGRLNLRDLDRKYTTRAQEAINLLRTQEIVEDETGPVGPAGGRPPKFIRLKVD